MKLLVTIIAFPIFLCGFIIGILFDPFKGGFDYAPEFLKDILREMRKNK